MTLQIARSRPGLKRFYDCLPNEVKRFFADFPKLVDSTFGFDILLAYMFLRLEQGQHHALYCGARKLHRTESSLTRKALDSQRMTRERFETFFKNIFNFSIGTTTKDCIQQAEKIRDRVVHGKSVEDRQKREAICRVLEYAQQMNDLIAQKHSLGFMPFSRDLRGLTGRMRSLDKSTTRWILKGMGFTLS